MIAITKGKRTSFQRSLLLLLLAAGIAGLAALRGEQPAKPSQTIPLATMGFPGYSVALLHAGASMATVHMLDGTHVLFTYSMRSLVPRLAGDDGKHSDRVVAAVLLDTASDKVLGRARWRLHDHGRYLWRVSNGVFVLRMGDELSAFAPMEALSRGQDPFLRYALPHRAGEPVLVTGSPDGKVVTVELEDHPAPVLGDEDPDARSLKHYILEFYRLDERHSSDGSIQIEGAGAMGSPALLQLPLDGDGYLWAEDAQRGHWTVSFNEFGGKQQPLAAVLSSCRPKLSLLSRSEFLVQSCRGSDDSQVLSAYGFDGHENWEEQLGATLQRPSLALAPGAGRFAISRLAASSGGAPTSGIVNDDPLDQEIRVYQTESGDMLLRVVCSPTARSAENFDLSPDGREMAVLGTESLDLYHLPELSERDRKDLKEVQGMTPPVGSGPLLLAHIARPIRGTESAAPPRTAEESGKGGAPGPDTASSVAEAGASAAAVTAGSTGSGTTATEAPAVTATSAAQGATVDASTESSTGHAPDGDTAATRTPPTLLNPGETAEFHPKHTEPQ